MPPPSSPDDTDAIAYGWRRSIIWRSVPIAIACGALALLLATAVDGASVWRFIGVLVLVFVAGDSVRFVVRALRHAAIRVDRAGIEFYGERQIPWTAIEGCSIVAADDGHELVLVLAEDAPQLNKARWMSAPGRRYWNRVERARRFELDAGVLAASPAQLAAAVQRFGPRAVHPQRPG